MYELKHHGNERSTESADKPQNAALESMQGKESLVHRQRQESEQLRNGGHSNITSEFGKPQLIGAADSPAQGNCSGSGESIEKQKHRADVNKHEAMGENANRPAEPVTDEKNKAAADLQKQQAMENSAGNSAGHGNSRPEGTGSIALDQDEQKPHNGVIQVLRNPNAEPLRTNDHMTPLGAPTRPQWSWDSGDPDAVPPDYVQPGGNRAVPEPLWPESDTLRESTDAWRAQHPEPTNTHHRRNRFL